MDDLPQPVMEETSEEAYLFLKAHRLAHLESMLHQQGFNVLCTPVEALARLELPADDLRRLTEALERRRARLAKNESVLLSRK